jgi:hypothetical protein
MKADILTLETAKKIADLERDVLYYKETRDELITNNVKLREEKLLLEKRIRDLEKVMENYHYKGE